jgi:predicted N-acetyltransferase YhbS
MSITIRPEQVADEQSIEQLIEEAFRSHPHSQQTEHWIVAHLRRSQALTLSLVAVETTTEGETVVGHVAFSPVTTSAGLSDWYGLGPLAVKVTKQR